MLTLLMGRAMNRSITNVLFGAFGQVSAAGGGAAAGADGGTVRSATADDVAVMLAYASKVVVVPGYGMAVAQAQHDVRALADILEARGIEVTYAIHPVAGRMPGHMNVLLAEANVPYPQLKEMDEANAEFARTDVVARDRRERRRQPRRAQQRRQPDLRHADPERRPVAGDRRAQALDEPGLRRHRQPALPEPEDRDAVRRRQGVGRRSSPPASRRCDGVPVFTARHVEQAVSPDRAVDAVRDAFVAHARGEWTMPPKVYVTNYPAGDFRAMPALGGGHALLKWINSFPGNPRTACRR